MLPHCLPLSDREGADLPAFTMFEQKGGPDGGSVTARSIPALP
jgi:hypothetical protein